MTEVRCWLEQHRMGKYADAFERNEFDSMEALLNITEQDLIDMNITRVGARRKILTSAANERNKQAKSNFVNTALDKDTIVSTAEHLSGQPIPPYDPDFRHRLQYLLAQQAEQHTTKISSLETSLAELKQNNIVTGRDYEALLATASQRAPKQTNHKDIVDLSTQLEQVMQEISRRVMELDAKMQALAQCEGEASSLALQLRSRLNVTAQPQPVISPTPGSEGHFMKGSTTVGLSGGATTTTNVTTTVVNSGGSNSNIVGGGGATNTSTHGIGALYPSAQLYQGSIGGQNTMSSITQTQTNTLSSSNSTLPPLSHSQWVPPSGASPPMSQYQSQSLTESQSPPSSLLATPPKQTETSSLVAAAIPITPVQQTAFSTPPPAARGSSPMGQLEVFDVDPPPPPTSTCQSVPPSKPAASPAPNHHSGVGEAPGLSPTNGPFSNAGRSLTPTPNNSFAEGEPQKHQTVEQMLSEQLVQVEVEPTMTTGAPNPATTNDTTTNMTATTSTNVSSTTVNNDRNSSSTTIPPPVIPDPPALTATAMSTTVTEQKQGSTKSQSGSSTTTNSNNLRETKTGASTTITAEGGTSKESTMTMTTVTTTTTTTNNVSTLSSSSSSSKSATTTAAKSTSSGSTKSSDSPPTKSIQNAGSAEQPSSKQKESNVVSTTTVTKTVKSSGVVEQKKSKTLDTIANQTEREKQASSSAKETGQIVLYGENRKSSLGDDDPSPSIDRAYVSLELLLDRRNSQDHQDDEGGRPSTPVSHTAHTLADNRIEQGFKQALIDWTERGNESLVHVETQGQELVEDAKGARDEFTEMVRRFTVGSPLYQCGQEATGKSPNKGAITQHGGFARSPSKEGRHSNSPSTSYITPVKSHQTNQFYTPQHNPYDREQLVNGEAPEGLVKRPASAPPGNRKLIEDEPLDRMSQSHSGSNVDYYTGGKPLQGRLRPGTGGKVSLNKLLMEQEEEHTLLRKYDGQYKTMLDGYYRQQDSFLRGLGALNDDETLFQPPFSKTRLEQPPIAMVGWK
eukprot:TRINITY_DN52498_c0_g1_i1.p1 TRINITY_DN52498_c0_g1~~TRINITY_DN52498_c0_g1_i1.p1  ORF type:complete len:1020 (+),score=141.77 TRINITY_DN52498_c0_g1_i1:92-3151(+)